MKRALYLLLLLFIVTSTASAKVVTAVTLKDGRVFEGTKIEENNQIVRLELANRGIRILYKSDIVSISTFEKTTTELSIAEEAAKTEAKERKQVERRELQQLHGKGYHQFVDLSYSYCRVTDFLGINYIGGYRFNPYIFLGLGTGVNFALFTPDTSKLNPISCKPTTVNVPIYIHFKANFTKSNWSPYLSVSVGGRISKSIYQEIENKLIRYNQSGFWGDVALGVDRKITDKLSLYLGIGYKMESFLHLDGSNKLLHGFSLHTGLSF